MWPRPTVVQAARSGERSHNHESTGRLPSGSSRVTVSRAPTTGSCNDSLTVPASCTLPTLIVTATSPNPPDGSVAVTVHQIALLCLEIEDRPGPQLAG